MSAFEIVAIVVGVVGIALALTPVFSTRRTLAQLGPGDFMGEMGAMRHAKRSASVVAKSPMTVIVMTDRDLRHLEHEMPSVHRQLCAAVEERSAALAAPASG